MLPRSKNAGHRLRALLQRWGAWLPTLLAVPAFVVVVLQFSSLEAFLRLARQVEPEWLALAVLSQLATYLCDALVWRSVLVQARHHHPLHALFRLSIAKLYTDQAFPSGGLSGSIFVVAALRRRGVPATAATAALLVGMLSYYAGYLTVALLSLLILRINHHEQLGLVAAVAALAALAIAVPAGFFWMKRRLDSDLPPWLKRIAGANDLAEMMRHTPDTLLRNPLLLAQSTLLQAGVFAFDSLTLWLVLQALGTPLAYPIAFAALVGGSIAATISPMPLGIGTFEFGIAGILVLSGLALEPAVAAAFMLRGFTFWLPMLPGLLVARRELAHRHRPREAIGTPRAP